MRVVLALVLVIGIVALAWVTFSGDGGGEGRGSPVDPRPERESGADVRETVRTESDSVVREGPAPSEEREEIPAWPWGEPDWKTEMKRVLDERLVTLELDSASLDDLVAELDRSIPYAVDGSGLPATARLVTWDVRYQGERCSRVIERVAAKLRAEVHLGPERIRLLPPGIQPEHDGTEVYVAGLRRAKTVLDAGGPRAAPLVKILPLDVENEFLVRVLVELGNRIGTPVELDPRVPLDRQSTVLNLKLDQLTVARVLDEVTRPAGLTWAAEERRILVTTEGYARRLRDERERAKANAAKEVSVAFKDRPLHFVAEEVGKQIGVPVVVDRALWEPDHPRITLRAGPLSAGKLLRKLAPLIPARFLVRGEAIYLIPPAGR